MVLEGPGTPDADVLVAALRAVVEAQPALACRWRVAARGLVGERVDPLPPLPIGRHEVATEADVAPLVAELVDRPIAYDDFPLVGWDVIRHPGGTVLLQREHHLIHDGWSVGAFLRDLQAAYDAIARGEAWRPDHGPATFFDWARAERRWIAGPESETSRTYWLEQLAQAASASRPLDGDPDPQVVGAGFSLQPLGHERSARLERTAAALGVTPYSLLLATYRTVMSGAPVVGSAFANRDVDTRDCVGMFVHVLPLVRHPVPGETVGDAARAERALVAEAARHQRIPTPEILRLARPVYSPGTSDALYPVLFSQHDSPLPELRLGSWRPAVRELSNGHGKTELNVIVMNRELQHLRSSGSHGPSAYTLRWEHDLARWSAAQVRARQQRFDQLLDHALAHPDEPWADPKGAPT
jgi:hypothetical protein